MIVIAEARPALGRASGATRGLVVRDDNRTWTPHYTNESPPFTWTVCPVR